MKDLYWEQLVKDAKDTSVDKTVQVAFLTEANGAFRPTPFMSFGPKVDLFENNDELEKAFKEIVESCKEIDPDISEDKLKNFAILEMPINMMFDLLKRETEFSILNIHLKITPDQCYVLDKASDFIHDPEVSVQSKMNILALNYAVKVMRSIDLDCDEGFHVGYIVEKPDMKITLSGAVEKYPIKYFGDWDIVIYKVSR